MKDKKQQVEIMTKALLSRCSGIYSQEALGNEIIDYADRVVKLLAAPAVSDSLPVKYCPQCGEPLARNKHKFWCIHSGNDR